MALTLSTFFAGYGSYHSNGVNKFIHILCVPMIFWSAAAIITHYSVHIDLNLGHKALEFNYAVVFCAVLSAVYLYVDFFSGLVSTVLYSGLTLLNNCFYNTYIGTPAYDLYFKAVLGIFAFSWIAQFVGHGVFEKRAPALLDNILQVFVAPDFVVIEVLFMLGYKPQAHKEAMSLIKKNITEFKETKGKKGN